MMISALSQFIFGDRGGLFGGRRNAYNPRQWKNHLLGFDLRQSELELDSAEVLLASFFPIEDVKGNPDEMGLLKITNQRVIWICAQKKRVNLAIGWHTVSIIFEQNFKDSLGAPLAALVLMTTYEDSNYEFVFSKMGSSTKEQGDTWYNANYLIAMSHLSDNVLSFGELTPNNLVDCFDVLMTVWKCYMDNNLYRECQANLVNLVSSGASSRSASGGLGSGNRNSNSRTNQTSKQRIAQLTKDAINFAKLSGEETILVYDNISLIETRNIQHVGTLVLTNIRILWIDDKYPVRNMSIPYSRIETIKVKQTNRLLIDTFDYLAASNQIELTWRRSESFGSGNGDTSIGKRTSTNPGDKDKPIECELSTQTQNLYLHYRSKPRFGPESSEECIRIASLLRPIEDFSTTSKANFENWLQSAAQDLGVGSLSSNEAGKSRPKTSKLQSGGQHQMLPASQTTATESEANTRKDTEDLDRNERQLKKFVSERYDAKATKMASYATRSRPVGHDQPIIYSLKLGLSLEKPPNGTSVRQTWQIDL